MKKQIQHLKEFHTAFNLPQRTKPIIIPIKEFQLRHDILVEEVEELAWAYEKDDIVEVADAITDCLYVLIGTALQFGLADKLEDFFEEVHDSNMSKLGADRKPIMREDGKVMKGPFYFKPDLSSIIKKKNKFPDYILSERGKDWKGNKLNEDTLPENSLVVWRGKIYDIGNRRNNLVELYEEGNSIIVTVVNMTYIYLARKK